MKIEGKELFPKNKVNKMKEFWKNILNSDNPTSSKRLVSLISLVLFIGIVVCHLTGIAVSDQILYSTVGLVLTPLGLTVFK